MFKTLAGLETSDDDTEIDEPEIVNDSKVNVGVDELHYLNRQWDLWYHDPNNSDYSLSSYINLGTLDTIEKFWHYYYHHF